MNKYIAVVDDEPDILELVALNLKKANFRVKTFAEVDPFYRSLKTEVPDLIILDLMMPDVDGFEVCKYLRNKEYSASVPIIMLTAKTEETDKVLGLELGADDYVTKPFSPRELIARVKAVLRRHGKQEPVPKIITIDDVLSIDMEKYEVKVNGNIVDLTLTEFRILQLLASTKGRIQSRDQILSYLWGDEKYVIDRTIDVHIRHLREKLGETAYIIKNVRGLGYKIEA